MNIFLSLSCKEIYDITHLPIHSKRHYCCLLAKLSPTVFVVPWTVPTRLLCPCKFPGKNTGVGCHFLLQGIFPTQGLNSHLLNWKANSLPQSYLGSPFCSVQLLSRVRLFGPHESQHARPPCPSPTPGVHSDSRPSSL